MKVLLATEGSEFSMAAADQVGKLLGNANDAELRIVSVADPPLPATEPFAMSPEYIEQIDQAVRERAAEVVAAAEADIRERYPSMGALITTAVLIGAPEKMIVEEAEDWGADLIVTGSHGYGFWKRAWLGSVSSAVVHHAPCSVLVVRPRAASQEASA